MEWAADVAGRYGARVTLLFAPELHSLRDAPLGEAIRGELLEARHAANDEMLARMARICEAAGIPVETRQVEGSPAAVIAGEAEAGGYDLIVMGSLGLGLGEQEQQLIGSVTERVLRRVACPVLVVK